MAELKRDFSGAKMNKDMDERVLPSGQYRDANNIQIATSDGADVGALQSLMGNTEVTNGVVPVDYSTCVGILPLPEKDLIYYFIAGGGIKGYQPLVRKDYIIEYDTISKSTKYVFVDIYSVTETQVGNNNSASLKYFIVSDNGDTINTTGIRKGMYITGTFTNHSTSAVKNITLQDNVLVTDIVRNGNNWLVYHDYEWDNGSGGSNIPVTNAENIYFTSPKRVLNFNALNKLTAINHLDGMIFWTDNITEPKKINIKRSLLGTGGSALVNGWDDSNLGSHANNSGNSSAKQVPSALTAGDNAHFHTRLVIDDVMQFGYEVAMERNDYKPIWVEEEHITVIKKSPKAQLELEMLETSLDRTPDPTASVPEPDANLTYTQSGASGGGALAVKFTDSNNDPLETDTVLTGFYFADDVDFRAGDTLIWTNDLTLAPTMWDPDSALVRTQVTSGPSGMPNNGGSNGPYSLKILGVDPDVPSNTEIWQVRLEDKPALFEFKFPRFSYRWKYQDGEYSCFAPWTEVAFIPGDFDYLAKKGYNLGMRNKLRSLRLKNYFSEFPLVPSDVVQVDLLYKEEGKTTVYTVKEITRKDAAPEWPDRKASNYNRGVFTLTSEMIHSVVPSNQMLRPWDNVPRMALAQEMTSNRLVYGNYKQNYSITDSLQLTVDIKSENKAQSQYEIEIPEKSVKTLRTYQVGVVYLDEFGRESPVLIPKNGSSVTLDKKWSCHTNRLSAKLESTSPPPSWAKYMKYYVKETSNEYYNLSMDRWYDAEDGNVWLSFPSAERNKIDEDTYLILKNEHDSNKPVLEEGRYKVIAIDPDAPTYVKTNKKSHGAAKTDEQSGSTIAGLSNIICTNAEFEVAYGTSWMADVYAKAGPGSLYARVTATSGADIVASAWESIVAIRTLGSGEKSIKLRKSIGDSADASSTLSGTITYRIEIREDVIENRPEFDGRFFVKVYKDLLLQQAIMKELDAEKQFTIIGSYNMRYICGQGGHSSAHPANPTNASGTTHQYNSGNYNFVNNWSASFNNSNKQGYCGARTRTKSWWEDMPSNNWFIDGVGHKNSSNWSTGSGWHNADNGVDNSHSGGLGPGNGSIRHYSTYSRIWFGIRRKGPDVSGAAADFRSDISKVGTIFRFRDDPNSTPYVVKTKKGTREIYNYHKGSSCKSCKWSWGSCRRTIIVIDFEKLEGGGPMDWQEWDPLSAYKHDGTADGSKIDILQIDMGMGGEGSNMMSTDNPAIWETEPKEDVGLDIYYEASSAIPLDVDHKNNELLIPLFSTFWCRDASGAKHVDSNGDVVHYKVTAVNSTSNEDITSLTISPALTSDLPHDNWLRMERYDGSYIHVYSAKETGSYSTGDQVIKVSTGKAPTNLQTGAYQPHRAPHHSPIALGYSNCWQFGNGIESDRIRDDYNAPQLTNGVKASTVLAEPYSEEHRSSGLIWSGIFNSTSGVNNLNQFIQAEPITKDLNPSYGSLQKLVARNTDTLAFCEDKVLNLLTSKDALYNADGKSNVTASNAVIGQSTPIKGDYGISTDPESLALTPHGMYWVDQMRGQVLSLEGGVTIRKISDIGMKDWFNDNLQDISEITGTYDDKKGEYNVTIGKKSHHTQFRSTKTTLSFNELTKGWVSFKSFGPEHGVSLNNEYYTFNEGSMWQHHTNSTANNFYGTQYYSDVTLLFNDDPGSVKSFSTLNYEGTQAAITPFTTTSVTNASGDTWNITDEEYYNLWSKNGWYVENIQTNLQDATVLEFKNKEGKWFSTIKGVSTQLTNLDEQEFSVQGLGFGEYETVGPPPTAHKIYVQPNPTATDGTNWDSGGADSSDWGYNSSTTSAMSGTTIAAGYTDITLHNITYQPGGGPPQYSGLDLYAKEFEVPGGTKTAVGPTFEWTNAGSWNADPEVTKVVFSDNGTGGDPGNSVNCRIHHGSYTMPSANKTIYVDVDYPARTNPPGGVDRMMCLHVSYNVDHGNLNTRATVAPVAVSNITLTQNMGLLANPTWKSDKWGQNMVLESQSTKVAEYTVTADAGYHLSPMSGGHGVKPFWFTRTANAAWKPYYSWSVADTYHTSSGNTSKIASSTIEIYYTPPVGVTGLDPDPMPAEGSFCSHIHDIRFDFLSRQIVEIQAMANNLSWDNPNLPAGSSAGLTIGANAAGTVKLTVVRQSNSSTPSHSYNFSNGTWVAIEGEGTPLSTTLTFTGASTIQESFTLGGGVAAGVVYSAYLTVDSGDNALALDSTVADAINEENLTIIGNTGTQTFTPGAKANTTAAGSLTIPSYLEMSTVNQNHTFSFTHTGAEGKTVSANNTPSDSDITGAYNTYPLNANHQTADTVIAIADTTGIKAGMYVLDEDFENGEVTTSRIKSGTVVSSINANTSITIDQGTLGAMTSGDKLIIKSDWEYELVSATTSVNNTNAANVLTTTGVLKIKKYGKTSPDGDIVLQPNYITVT